MHYSRKGGGVPTTQSLVLCGLCVKAAGRGSHSKCHPTSRHPGSRMSLLGTGATEGTRAEEDNLPGFCQPALLPRPFLSPSHPF